MRLTEAIQALKSVSRTGWMQHGLKLAESIAEHSFESALLALELASAAGINAEKAAALALVHDVPEAIMGDMPKWTSERVRRVDAEAIREIESVKIAELFREFEEGRSNEAKIARLCDLLATNLQAKRYMKQGYNVVDIEEKTRNEIAEMLEDEALKPIRERVVEFMQRV
ncbi:MAG: HD domain-containing protein [Candidatus Methanodesulfokora sp.]